ncbi:MAG TPA: hypothetical protein VGH19_15625 [Verrucomicrobiae bacterium]
MTRILLFIGALLGSMLLCGCRSAQEAKPSSPLPTAAQSVAKPTPKPLYMISAGGPHSVVGLDRPPESNHVAIAFSRQGEASGIYRLTNHEPVRVLIWNVRVQVPAKDSGTDGFGWKTVHDDYPTGLKGYNIPPGGADEIEAPMFGAGPWRVCVLYSKEKLSPDGKYRFYGSYEIVSRELNEDQLRGPMIR